MRDVRLVHNPFTEKCTVYFDGNKYGTSTISSYLNDPFLEWADKIIEAISAECNDNYSLTYIGFEIYGRILKYFALKDSLCQKFTIANPSLAESVKSRLGKLSQMCLSGLEIPRISKQIFIYSDLPKEKIEEILPKPVKLAFCKISFIVKGLALPQQEQDGVPAFVVSDKPPGSHRNLSKCIYFQITNENSFCGIANELVLEKCESDKLGKILYEYVDLVVMTPILHNVVEERNVDKHNPTQQPFFMLDKIEPEYLMKIPSSIELGKRETIACEVLPKGYNLPIIEHAVLDSSIIRISGNAVETLGTGDTFIDTKINGETVWHQGIKVYRRNRATKIEFPVEQLNIAVGEEIPLQLNYSPYGADNIPLIKFDVVGAKVSISRQTVDTISVKALATGESKIIAKLEDLKARLIIFVYQKLVRLKIVTSKQSISIGDIIKLQLVPEPSDALIGDLQYEIVPKHIARYDATINAIVGQQRGSGKLVVNDLRNNIQSKFDFNVT